MRVRSPVTLLLFVLAVPVVAQLRQPGEVGAVGRV